MIIIIVIVIVTSFSAFKREPQIEIGKKSVQESLSDQLEARFGIPTFH
jgi:hypothetical protein